MGKLALVFVLAALLLSTQIAAGSNVVTLSASDVTSALDIEQAIGEATGQGAYPGVVILNGDQGPFTYSELDRTINISHSGITLRGKNGAAIANCDDGVVLEGPSVNHIVIEGIVFHCLNSGILAIGDDSQWIAIRNNSILGAGFGIQVNGGHHWSFSQNVISAGVDAINLSGTTNVKVNANQLSGYEIALFLDHVEDSMVENNWLWSSWQGILLANGASTNKIVSNRIYGPRDSGISLESGSLGNKIHGNSVSCAPGHQCLAVSGTPEIFENNKISGNKTQQ